MKYFLVILFSLVLMKSNTLYAADSISLRKYYELTHSAAIQICKGKIGQAALLYDSALMLIPYPFFVDLNNAVYAQINLPKPNVKLIHNYLKSIQKMGICVHEEYEKIEKYQPYLSMIREDDCKQIINVQAENVINKALYEDQRVRKLHPNVYHSSVMPLIKTTDSVNYLIADSILRLAEKANLPIENYIGNKCTHSLFVLLLHSEPWGNYNKDILDRLAEKGLLEARRVAALYDDYCNGHYDNGKIDSDWREKYDCIRYGSMYGSNILVQTQSKAFIFKSVNGNYDAYNKKRSKLYLMDVLEDAKIKVFSYYNQGLPFKYPFIKILAVPEEGLEAFEASLSKYDYIKYDSKEDYDFDRK